jgi:hypothetical protein
MRITTRGLGLALGSLLLAWPVSQLAAQMPGAGCPGLEELRQRVRERVAQRLQTDLGLSDEQMSRLRGTVGTFATERRALQARQRTIRGELAGQLRPGVAAVPDSVARLMNQLADVRVRYAETYRAELAEMSRYLDPVQRARIVLLRERLAARGRAFQHRPILQGHRWQ